MLANETPSNGSSIEERAVKSVLNLESWYAAEFDRRLGELTELMKAQLQIQIEELRARYEEARQVSAGQPECVSSSSPATTPAAGKILEEIERNEGMLQKCASELERMVGDDSVSLGLLLQMRNQQLELKAYLRGLKFCASTSGSATAS